jgi:predicted metalloprotease with PDZ domain
MRALWERYGRDFYPAVGRGVTEAEVEALFDEVSGLKLRPMFEKYVRGTEDLPLAKLFAPFGIKLLDERKSGKPSFDAGIGRDPLGAKLTQVHEGGAAHQAGLSALDIVIAIDGLRAIGNPSNVDGLLSRYRVGDKVTVHAFRRDELMAFELTLQGDRVPGISLSQAVAGKKSSTLRRPSAA